MQRGVAGATRVLHLLAGPLIDAAPDEDERTIRQILATAYLSVALITPLWGATYIAFGEVGSGLIPIVYGGLTAASFAMLRRPGGWEWLRVSQLVQHLLLPFILMWSLGGFSPSSAVLIWALLAPLGSLWADRTTEAFVVVGGFGALTVVSALINSSLSGDNGIPEWANTAFYAANFIVMTTVIVLLIAYFGREHAEALAVMRRNRELESAYLQQEVSLRQNEKLATIGKLGAGLAHELNNPAAAVQQATRELSKQLLGDSQMSAEIDRLGLSESEQAAVRSYAERIRERVDRPHFIDSLDRSDREQELERVLESVGVDRGWDSAPALVTLGIEPADIERLRVDVEPGNVPGAIAFLASQYERQSLVGSLDESAGRIIAMVRALKSYTHLDEAPRQLINVHEGLDSTLVMLQNRLKSGIEVRRDYATDLPEVEALGGELNQVWTNILDNAIDAMDGQGVLTIATHRDGDTVVVELGDTGPGVPPELLATIFDPFVTSKAPGEGTGLGLNISHRIVTQKHGGQISVESAPGHTTFTVQLPIGATGHDDGERTTVTEGG